MSHLPSFSTTAALIADPTRAIMLTALLDGRALPAGELAYASGITPQTASSHLSQLLAGGLLTLESEGRHRYYRLAGSHVAHALEHLAAIRPAEPVRRKALSPQGQELRFCRRCYDHLAGQVGVAVTHGLQQRGFIFAAANKQFEVPAAGIEWFETIGLKVNALKATRRGLAQQCLDWTERTHHLAGPLGVGLLAVMCANDWLRQAKDSRAVHVTPKGWTELRRHLGVESRLGRAVVA